MQTTAERYLAGSLALWKTFSLIFLSLEGRGLR
jgi:hypothetical protein